jgi:glycosyltransferase involved in cell wall biosynthesis
MDALYIGLQRTSLFRFGISPNKLMDYMMAAKPVIQAIDAGNDMVADSGCGISLAPEDPRALADAIAQLAGLPAAERAAMGQRGREHVRRHHDYRVLAARFLDALR